MHNCSVLHTPKKPAASIMSAKFVPYSGKLSREKTFVNFAVLWLFAQVFSAKFGSMAQQKQTICEFSLRKSYFSPICESFLPQKFPAIIMVFILKADITVVPLLKDNSEIRTPWLFRTFD